MLVVECYDPSTFRFVKDISLFKNEEQVPFVKSLNSIDFLKQSSFATNGQAIIIQTAKRVYFFDIKTGVRVQKANSSDFGINHDECRMIYDFQNNQFYSFKYGIADTRMEAFTITNFKKGGVSFGFAKEFLSKRINLFKTIVYGGDASSIEGTNQAPHQLNLI